MFGVAPVGSTINDLFPRDAEHGDYLTHSVLDLYSTKRYDIYWDEKGKVRRRGDDATMAAITASPGCALVLPFRDKLLFAVLGEASGFPSRKNQLIDHCTPGAEGGCGWGTGLWDHWPIGWLNSQTSFWKPGSPYAYSFGSVGQFFVPEGKRIKIVLEGLSGVVQRHGAEPLDGQPGLLRAARRGQDVGRRPPYRSKLARQGPAVRTSRRVSPS